MRTTTNSTGYDPARDIPNLSGKTFLVTGGQYNHLLSGGSRNHHIVLTLKPGTAGLGLSMIKALCKKSPGHICILARNETKAAKAVAALQEEHPDLSFSFIKGDTSNLSSIQSAAQQFLAARDRLDVLVCNAGVMGMEPAVTEDGFQVEFQTCHIGHALLIKLLLPLLRATAKQHGDVRIVSITSYAYMLAPRGGIEFDTLTTGQARIGGFLSAYVPGAVWTRYGQNKLANMIYADALARRHPDITSVSVHPGVIWTAILEGRSFRDRLPAYFAGARNTYGEEEGAYCQLWAATTPRDNIKSGTYYEPVGVAVKRTSSYARDEQLSDKLWDWTQEAIKKWE